MARAEAFRSADRPGVDREALVAYADALERDGPAPLSAAEVERLIETRLTTSEERGDGAPFESESGRVSISPSARHEAVRNTTDPREYARVLDEGVAAAHGTSEPSVPVRWCAGRSPSSAG